MSRMGNFMRQLKKSASQFLTNPKVPPTVRLRGRIFLPACPYLSFDVSDKIASVRLIQAGRRLLLRQFLPPHELKQVNTKGFAEFLMQTLNISKRIPENFSSVLLQSSRDKSNLLSVLNNEFQNKATALKLLGSCQEGVCHPVHIADLAGVNVDVLGEVKIKVDTYIGFRL